MGNDTFERICKKLVANYANEHLDITDGKTVTEDDVYICHMGKALQNNKAQCSTTLHDGMYYEITHNGDKQEIYFDAYKKFENRCYKVADVEVM